MELSLQGPAREFIIYIQSWMYVKLRFVTGVQTPERQEPLEMARRTKEEAQETRSRIIDAAESVFHERGCGQCLARRDRHRRPR